MKTAILFTLCLAAAAGARAAEKAPPAPPSVKAHTPVRKPVPPAARRIDQAVNRLLEQADVYWHRGEYDNVRATYAIITDLDPSYVDGWQNYGWILWAGLQRDDAAMRVFLRGLEYHPDRWEMYFEIANLEYHQRHFRSAAEWLAKATDHKPPMYVWHMRAHCLEYAGEVNKSKAMWKRIIAMFPDDPPAPANLKRLEEGRIRRNPVVGVEPLKNPAPHADGPDDAAPEETAPEEPPVGGTAGSI